MRMIDADQMAVDESEAYMSAQVQITDDLKWLVNFSAHSKIQKLIADTPTVDAVPVVRCKDCVNGTVFVNKQGAEYVDCVLDDYSVRKPTDYCSYGKRKEGADNEP